MAACYKFSVIRFSPDDTRDERINIGLAVFTDEGLDVRLARRLDKVRAISAAVDIETLRRLVDNIRVLDASAFGGKKAELEERYSLISALGPVTLSSFGDFYASDADSYEQRIASILKAMVDAEPATPQVRLKRSKLLTQVKALFRQQRVLARKDESFESHRIVSSVELDEGLVADLVLRNGSMHVVETVDFASIESSPRKVLSEIGIAALVLERARMKFGENETNARLVYNASPAIEKSMLPSLTAAEHQGATLVNWASADQRGKFVHSLASLATPLELKRPKTGVRFHVGQKSLQ